MEVLGGDFDKMEGEDLTDTPPADPPADPNAAPPSDGSEGTPAAAAPSGEPAGDAPAPAAPAESKKEPGSKRYKRERDEARTELETIRTREAALQAERDRLAADLEALKKAPPATPRPAATPPPAAPASAPVPATPPPAEDLEPKEEDFEDVTKFLIAHSSWQVRDEFRKRDRQAQELAETTRKQSEEQQRTTVQQQEAERWNNQLAAARVERPDFDAVFQAATPKLKGAPVLATSVRDREDGAKLLYFFCQHPEIENRLSELVALPPNASERQVRIAFATAHFELEKIAADLKKATPPPAPAAPPAPPAPTPPPAAPPAAQAPPQATPPAKVSPPTPIGNRGNPGYRRLEHMTPAEQAAMDLDEYRRRRELGEG